MTCYAKPRHQRPYVSRGESIQAPTGGWDTISPLANMPADRAIVLDNWFPQAGYVELRGGHSSFCNTGSGAGVETLMAYHGATTSADKLFAASGTVIYDVTTGTASSAVTSLANARWQHVNFTTTGGKFLMCCNGSDSMRAYNGSSWVTPTISGITSSDIVNLNVHKNRIWFILKDSLKAAYLRADSYQGDATTFDLSGVFTRGGYLVAMGTWSLDDAGAESYAAFITSRGEVAIYLGTDPNSATTWGLKGTFIVGSPLGKRCFCRLGADLAIVSIDGVMPLSQALVIDRGTAVKISLTTNIQPTMNASARSYGANYGWQLISYPRGTQVILNVPAIEGITQHQYVMNSVTGAWCRYTGMNAVCWEVWKDRLFFGGNSGVVYEADKTGSDNGTAIQMDMRTAFNYFKKRGNNKVVLLVRPILTTDGSVTPGIGISVDFSDGAPVDPTLSTATPTAKWDSGVWDVDIWPAEETTITNWDDVGGIGYCASIRMKMSVNSAYDNKPTLRVNGFDVILQDGGFI